MPRKEIDYSKTIIYKIVCNDLSIKECYVGHTTDFITRKSQHKSDCNNEKSKSYNLRIYSFIRDNGGWCSWSMIEIEKFPCNDLNEAKARERYWIETLQSTLNYAIPLRTLKEHYEDNKLEVLEKMKNYYQHNKEEIKNKHKYYRKKKAEYFKEKVECECGCIVSRDTMRKHIKTDKHKLYLTTYEKINLCII